MGNIIVNVASTVAGPQGDPGQGVPVGGTAGQVLEKIDGTDYNTQWADPSGGAGLVGWEVAELVEGPGQYLANKTELQRAYATGSPIYIPPGTYELDDCQLTGQTDCIIWADNVTLKWADDPLLGTRETESMLDLQAHRDVVLRGLISFDGNEASAYTNNNVCFRIEEQGNGRYLFWDDIVFRDVAYWSMYVNRDASNDKTYKLIKGGSVSLFNAYGFRGFQIRAIAEKIEIDSLYTTDGGPTNTKSVALGYDNTRGAFGISGGTSGVFSEQTDSVIIKRMHSQNGKTSIFEYQAVKSMVIGDVLVEDFMKNEDGTDAEWDGTGLVMMKISGLALTDEMRRESFLHINSFISRGTNNGGSLPEYNNSPNTIQANIQSIQIATETRRYYIGYLDVDAKFTLYTNGDIDEAKSEPGQVESIVYRGEVGSNAIAISGKVRVGSLLLDNTTPLAGETRNIYVTVKDAAHIGSVRSLGSSIIQIRPTTLLADVGNVFFQHESNVIINDAVLDSNNDVRIFLEDTFFNVDGIENDCAHLKVTFTGCNIQAMRKYFSVSGSLSNVLTAFRDRIEINVINSIVRNYDDTYSFKALFTDATTSGLLRTTSTAGAVVLTDNTGAGLTLTEVNDLPQGYKIYGSKLINSVLLTLNENYTGIDYTREIDASGFSGNLTTSDDTLQKVAAAVDALSLGGDIVNDTTPQLGGFLDTQGFDIYDANNTTAAKIGVDALANDDGVSRLNTAVGREALRETTSGGSNSAIGYRALFDNVIGAQNTAVGAQALNNSTGSNNTAIGSNALFSQGNLSDNTAIGKTAFYSLTAGTSNTAIGLDAGRRYGSGGTTLTSATDAVLIGDNARAGGNANTNEIAIGANVIGNGSNTATIGDDNVTDVYMSEDAGATVHAGKYKLSALNTAPANASDTGTTGEIRIAADYIYVCVATDTWVRAALATW